MTDYELYVDYDSDRLILEFPWQSGETDFDPEAAIEEIGSTAYLTFRKGSSADGELILDGSMVESAAAQYGPVCGSMPPRSSTRAVEPSASGWMIRT